MAETEGTTKTCTKCREDKSVAEFWKRNRSKDGLDSRCKACAYAASRAWVEQNRDHVRARGADWARQNRQTADGQERARQAKRKQTLKQYGLTEAEFAQMVLSQRGRCAICDQEFVANPHIDHDHDTGEVRQLLCDTCNVGLGMFKDKPELLRQAAIYLEKHG